MEKSPEEEQRGDLPPMTDVIYCMTQNITTGVD